MNDASSSFAARANRTQRTITVDNFLRKALRVSDPRDPKQIANALLSRYPEDADRDRRERAGLSYSSIRDISPAPVLGTNTALVELEVARGDFERDIATLTGLSQLKDITIELTGWGRAVRQTAADGIAAARLAIDVVSHDSALAARRTLGEYARLARYVGALSDGSGIYFRRFAQSCDVLSALILVAIGEGLAAAGITRSTSLVRVSASELQSRRNAVIMALRGLTGSVEAALGQEEYPRGIVGYQTLVGQLERGGQSDLRALLEENALSAAMDQLVDLSTSASVASLRELSTTASLLVHRFQRLIQYGRSVEVAFPADGIIDPVRGSAESPPLLTFVAALQLFADAFQGNGSNRLLYIARPPILAYGLYNIDDIGPERRLFNLTTARGDLARATDCLAACSCDGVTIRSIVLLDFVIALVDRAIDLLAVGTDDSGAGEPEQRAIAAGLAAREALVMIAEIGIDPGTDLIVSIDEIEQQLVTNFGGRSDFDIADFDQDTRNMVVIELESLYPAERRTEQVVRNLGGGCNYRSVFEPFIEEQGPAARDSIVCRLIRRTLIAVDPNRAFRLSDRNLIDLPPTMNAVGGAIAFGHAEYRQRF